MLERRYKRQKTKVTSRSISLRDQIRSLVMNLISFLIFTLNILIYNTGGVNGFSQRKIKFSVLNKKNITGHYVTLLSLKQTARDLPEVWKVDVEHEIIESEGLRTANLLTVLTVPPQLPGDYKLIPGIGYYKFHNESAKSFDDAVEICSQEGGHLAIINSEEESNALKGSIYGYTYVGFHDRIKEGEFITIFGRSLKNAGFNRWATSDEPNGGTYENCGTLYPNGGLNDISCKANIPFICEYDLSWIDG